MPTPQQINCIYELCCAPAARVETLAAVLAEYDRGEVNGLAPQVSPKHRRMAAGLIRDFGAALAVGGTLTTCARAALTPEDFAQGGSRAFHVERPAPPATS